MTQNPNFRLPGDNPTGIASLRQVVRIRGVDHCPVHPNAKVTRRGDLYKCAEWCELLPPKSGGLVSRLFGVRS